MKKIYKYFLMAQNMTKIPLPLDCKIISAEEQNGEIVVYAMVDQESNATQHYEFLVFGTGHDIHDTISNYEFLDTVKMENGALMFHVFYRKG